MILAKVSAAYCTEAPTLSPASNAAVSAQSASALSAAAIQAVSAIAAAAGLAYEREVATPCWVLLKGADSSVAAMTAAIKALKEPNDEVSAAGEDVESGMLLSELQDAFVSISRHQHSTVAQHGGSRRRNPVVW
jgi:hypothetical protein